MRKYLSILQYGKDYYANGRRAIFFLILYNLSGVFSLTLIIPFLNILFDEINPQTPVEALNVWSMESVKAHLFYSLDAWIADHDKFVVLIYFCAFLVGSILLKNAFRYLSTWNIAPLELGVIKAMRKQLFEHLSKLGLGFFHTERKGKIVNVLISDVQIIQESIIGTLQSVISDPLTMLVYLLTMFFLSWKLTLFTLLVLPLTGFVINAISGTLRRKARMGQERQGALIAVLDEFIGGIRVVKAFGSEAFEQGKYERENEAYKRLMISLKRRSQLASPLTEVLSIFVVAVIILYAGNMILNGNGELKPAFFIGFIALFSQFLAPIKTFSNAISKIQKGIASYERVNQFLAITSEVKEQESPFAVDQFQGQIEIREVGFSYGKEQVLKDINLTISKGETVALVGPSGGGKSTLVDMLPRFYDPQTGEIRMDGRDIKTLKITDLRGLFGVVTQECILFNDTVAHNIGYGETHPDSEKVMEAAIVANAHDFIQALPNGYATVIGERGTKLSGGQRQRLAIARSVYKNPPILILDEATSALDTESEKLVQDALNNLLQNRTSIIIAHRLSTITSADKIVVIQDGRIVEEGTHHFLLAKNGVYSNLFNIQLQELTKG